MRKPVVLSILIALTIVTAGLGLWRWQATRQEAAASLEAESRPSLTGTSRSVAPGFVLQDTNGQPHDLADLRGKVVLLNFWATWCPPCKAEMPDLDALYREYGGEKDFVVLGVNVEEDLQTVKPFVEEQKLGFPIVLDRTGHVTSSLYHVRPLPTTYIIDREGFIRDTWNGQISREAMLARLERVW